MSRPSRPVLTSSCSGASAGRRFARLPRRYDPGVPAEQPPVSMIRAALELSWAVAKVGGQARPPQPVPGRLRPLMKVSRLPDRMLNTVREVVDSDAEFRARVVAAADEDLLGRASWLWLVRQEGCEDELNLLIEGAEAAEEEALEQRSSRAAKRQLDELDSALQKLQAEIASLKAVNTQLEEQLASARKARREADAESARLRSALGEAAVDQKKSRAAADQLAETIKRLETEVTSATEGARDVDLQLVEAARKAEVLTLALAEAQRHETVAKEDSESLRRSLAELFASVRDVAEAAGVDMSVASSEASLPSAADAGPRTAGVVPTAQDSSSPRAKRVPAQLPPATFEDSPEAAQHLVRLPDAMLVVDGYNVTLTSWPGTDLPMQRRRLLDSLAELVARAGTEVLVIFDGVDSGNRLQLPSSVRGRMRVRFTASEIEADDAIIELVASLPRQRPVVVATNDRRVRDAAGERGANVISVDQLLAVLRRGSSSSG